MINACWEYTGKKVSVDIRISLTSMGTVKHEELMKKPKLEAVPGELHTTNSNSNSPDVEEPAKRQ